jgi:hypothetical protein
MPHGSTRTPDMPALCDIDVLFALVTDRDARHRAALSFAEAL